MGNRFAELMEPKPFWGLADYMQAIEFAMEMNSSPLDKVAYEDEVRDEVFARIKQAVLNLERFLESK